MRPKLIREYTDSNGTLIREYATPQNKKRTWMPFEKYRVANVGHQAMKLGSRRVS